MAKILKKLKGHSSSDVLLIEKNNKILIRKSGQVGRNLERIDALSRLNLPLPKIVEIYGDSYEMEYIHNLDIKSYMIKYGISNIVSFIKDVVKTFSKETADVDYSSIYEEKLNKIDFSIFPFNKQQLFERLPKILPSSEYHGDFTLENILFDIREKKFVLIDPLTTEYNSFIFDLAKLRQDLICKWFIRNDKGYNDSKLKSIFDELNFLPYMNDNSLLILMLLRILPYTKQNDDKIFLKREIEKLWK